MDKLHYGIAKRVHNGDKVVSATAVCVYHHDVIPKNYGYFCPEEKLLCQEIPLGMEEKKWIPVAVPYSAFNGFQLCHRCMKDGERRVELTGQTRNGNVFGIRLNENDDIELWDGHKYVSAPCVASVELEELWEE